MTALIEETRPTMYRNPPLPKWATDPTTTTEEESIEPSGSVVNLVVLSVLGIQSLPRCPARVGRLVFLESSVDQVGLPGETVATTAMWPTLWQEPEPHTEGEPPMGTFAPVFERDVLFTIDVNIEPSRLKHWDPEVTLHSIDLDPEDG